MFFRHGLCTSEAVSARHPGTLCDRVSDPILDPFLALIPHSLAACAIGMDDPVSGNVEAHGAATGENVR